MIDQGLTLYLKEASKHALVYEKELEELRADLLSENFKSRDYRAAERLLQIYTELCIGLSKHWLKAIDRETVSQAYQAFMLLKEQGQISADELNNWRKIIGMRNGLVHDYLTIDLSVVDHILINKDYENLSQFCKKAIEFLEQEK